MARHLDFTPELSSDLLVLAPLLAMFWSLRKRKVSKRQGFVSTPCRAFRLGRAALLCTLSGLGGLGAMPASATLYFVDTYHQRLWKAGGVIPIPFTYTSIISSLTPTSILNGTQIQFGFSSDGQAQVLLKGDLTLGSGDRLIGIGPQTASFIVGNNANIAAGASIDFSAGWRLDRGTLFSTLDRSISLAGPGGGGGGGVTAINNGGPGGVGGTGGGGGQGGAGAGRTLTTIMEACINNFPLGCLLGSPGQDGTAGGSGTPPALGGLTGSTGLGGHVGYRSPAGGGVGGLGGAGGSTPISGQAGGDKGTGFPFGGVSGFGGGGFNGEDGSSPDGSTGKGQQGGAGSSGSGGLNSGSGLTISGGSGGGSGGQGGGGSAGC